MSRWIVRSTLCADCRQRPWWCISITATGAAHFCVECWAARYHARTHHVTSDQEAA
jgi:hypothetical protein